jgi:hypothetical protein
MELALKIILGLVTAICFLGGINLMTKGAKSFLPETLPPQPRLDNLFRFLSGIYFGLGFLMLWTTIHSSQVGDLLYFIGITVFFSGLGRLYSRIKVGSAGTYYDSMMIIECCLGLSIVLLHYFGH